MDIREYMLDIPNSTNDYITICADNYSSSYDYIKYLNMNTVVFENNYSIKNVVTSNQVNLKKLYMDMIKEENKQEEENMIIYNFNKNIKIKKLVINEKEGVVTLIGEKPSMFIYAGPEKIVTMSKIVKGDKFDKYVGTAFAMGYMFFGSKTQFNNHLKKFYGCTPQEMEKYALIEMYHKLGGKEYFEEYVDKEAKYIIKEEKKPTPKKKPKSKKDKE